MRNAANTLRHRIQSESFEPDEELAIECYYDMNVFYSILRLMRDLYPNFYTPQNFEIMIQELDKTKQAMRGVIDDILLYNPLQQIIIRGFNPIGKPKARLRTKPRYEHRPNDQDYEKLKNLYLKLSEMTNALYET